MTTSNGETPINPKTYRFRPKRVGGPERAEFRATPLPTTYRLIHKIACDRGISHGKVLDLICSLDTVKDLAPNHGTDLASKAKTHTADAINRLFRPRKA